MNALDKIKEYIENNDSEEKISQSDLADIVGVSRQRVAQLIEQNDLRDVIITREDMKRRCVDCGEKMEADKFGKYCSDECKLKLRSEKYYVTLKCATCGKDFTIRKSEYKARCRNKTSDVFFCSKKCQGVRLGKSYGFGCPKNMKLGDWKLS